MPDDPQNPTVAGGFLKLALICAGVLLFGMGLMKVLLMLTE